MPTKVQRKIVLTKKNKKILLFCAHLIVSLAFAEVTWHSEMKRKTSFSFAFHSFFRNSAIKDGEVTPSR